MSTSLLKAFSFVIGLLAIAEDAAGDTYKCDAVDSLARLGYDGNEKVTIVGQDKVCKFSIGDASADGMTPPMELNLAIYDSKLLTDDPDTFISQRLAAVISESSVKFGATADFIRDEFTKDVDLSTLSCSSDKQALVGPLQIRCLVVSDADAETGKVLENGIITATLFRPMFVFEIIDQEADATALVIFIPQVLPLQ